MAKTTKTTKTPETSNTNKAGKETRTLPKKREPKKEATPVVTPQEETVAAAPVEKQEVVVVQEETTKKTTVFLSACGGNFTSDPNGTCLSMCALDTPDDYKACSDNFKLMLQERKSNRVTSTQRSSARRAASEASGQKKSPKRFDAIGDGVGTSAHMINVLLLEGATLEEIMDTVPCERTRVMGHMAGLKGGNTRRKPKIIVRDIATGRYFLEMEDGDPTCYFTL